MEPKGQIKSEQVAPIIATAQAQLKAENLHPDEEHLKLPNQIITKSDVSRLNREVEELEDFFSKSGLSGGVTPNTLPHASLQLTALVDENKLNLIHDEDRLKIGNFLKDIYANAPVVHASFATDPKPDFLMRIVSWFREQAHPNVLLQVGLQPGLAAGCIIRTTNKYFDFSFKKHFDKNKDKLRASLRGSS